MKVVTPAVCDQRDRLAAFGAGRVDRRGAGGSCPRAGAEGGWIAREGRVTQAVARERRDRSVSSHELGALRHAGVCKHSKDGGAHERLRGEHWSPDGAVLVAKRVAVELARHAAQWEGRGQGAVGAAASWCCPGSAWPACTGLPSRCSGSHIDNACSGTHHLARHMHLTLLSGSWEMSPGAWHLQGMWVYL